MNVTGIGVAYKRQVTNSQLNHSLEEHLLDDSVAVVSDGRAKQLDRFRFPNDADGYRYFHRRLATVQEREEAPAVLVGREPTNHFWKLLASDLERRQVPYRMFSPYTVKKHREGDQLSRSKNDYQDAFMIGDLLRTGKFTESQLLHGDYAELRQGVVLRDRLQGDIRRQKSLIRNIAGQLFPELSQEFTDFSCLTGLAMLRSTEKEACMTRKLVVVLVVLTPLFDLAGPAMAAGLPDADFT